MTVTATMELPNQLHKSWRLSADGDGGDFSFVFISDYFFCVYCA
jgi:hypothetical protein